MSKVRLVTRLGVDERNIARLVPVLALNRVASDLTGWTKTVVVDSLSSISVTCLAGNGQVVPHGIDGDTIFALTALYVLQGKPADGFIVISVADLCSLIGIKTNTHVYERIRDSITRLRHVSFEVFEAWASKRKDGSMSWSSASFGIINSLHEIDYEAPPETRLGTFQPTTLLKIGLSHEITESIKAGHVRSVDLEFYGGLEQPLSRLLFRTLEEQRQIDQHTQGFCISLGTWGDHLGMRNLVRDANGIVETVVVRKFEIPMTKVIPFDKIRRSLDPAHEELLKKGYLKDVGYVGRGKDQTIHYVFGIPQSPVDLELVGLLTQRGMSPKVAEQHARTYGAKAVNRAVEIFDARKAAGYMVRNAGGLLTDILVNPDKYLAVDASFPAKVGTAKPSRPVKPIIEAELAEPSIDEKRKTNAFVVDGWAKRKWLVGQQHQQLLDLVKHGRLDDAKLVSLGLSDAVAVQKFAMEVLARG